MTKDRFLKLLPGLIETRIDRGASVEEAEAAANIIRTESAAHGMKLPPLGPHNPSGRADKAQTQTVTVEPEPATEEEARKMAEEIWKRTSGGFSGGADFGFGESFRVNFGENIGGKAWEETRRKIEEAMAEEIRKNAERQERIAWERMSQGFDPTSGKMKDAWGNGPGGGFVFDFAEPGFFNEMDDLFEQFARAYNLNAFAKATLREEVSRGGVSAADLREAIKKKTSQTTESRANRENMRGPAYTFVNDPAEAKKASPPDPELDRLRKLDGAKARWTEKGFWWDANAGWFRLEALTQREAENLFEEIRKSLDLKKATLKGMTQGSPVWVQHYEILREMDRKKEEVLKIVKNLQGE